MKEIPDILKRIIERKHEEIRERSAIRSIASLESIASREPAARGFVAALHQKVASGNSAVIAECKQASPSKGVLRENYDPAQIARSYESGGAACLSVLTDADFFKGHEDHLTIVREHCALPVIRKDFIVDPYQVVESASIGADCILLIAAALDDDLLASLHQQALSLGLDVLVEVHDGDELERALALDLSLIGINNRDLRTFEVSLDTTLGLLKRVPEDVLVVTESGILDRADVQKMRDHGIHAFLVGEAFMKTPDPGATLQALFL